MLRLICILGKLSLLFTFALFYIVSGFAIYSFNLLIFIIS